MLTSLLGCDAEPVAALRTGGAVAGPERTPSR